MGREYEGCSTPSTPLLPFASPWFFITKFVTDFSRSWLWLWQRCATLVYVNPLIHSFTASYQSSFSLKVLTAWINLTYTKTAMQISRFFLIKIFNRQLILNEPMSQLTSGKYERVKKRFLPLAARWRAVLPTSSVRLRISSLQMATRNFITSI